CWITEIDDLDRCCAISQDALAGALCRTVQIDGDVYRRIVQQLGDALVGLGCDIMEAIKRADDARTYLAGVVRAQRYPDDLKARTVVTLEQLGNRRCDRVLPKVR